MTAHFQIYQDTAGGWRWRFVATNSRIMADSGEGYKTKRGAERAHARFVQLVRAGQ